MLDLGKVLDLAWTRETCIHLHSCAGEDKYVPEKDALARCVEIGTNVAKAIKEDA